MRKRASRKLWKKFPRCRAQIRHWFTYYGAVGSLSPVCQHCGAPNPYVTAVGSLEWDAAELRKWQDAVSEMFS